MSHQEEKNQAAKAKAKQNEMANKGQNQQGRQPGQPGQPGQPANRPQAGGREADNSSQLRWSEAERNEQAARAERNERDNNR
ncbi:MAG TPA: hypothetical protein VGM01_12535 [Ktedonobacteraceae bacterium]